MPHPMDLYYRCISLVFWNSLISSFLIYKMAAFENIISDIKPTKINNEIYLYILKSLL